MMNLRLLLQAVFLTACATPLFSAPITFVGFLTGPKEEPSNASPGTGASVVTIDPVAHTLQIMVTFTGLTGTTTASHIHVINGPGDSNTADTNGPVVTTVPTFPGFPLGVTAGAYTQTFDTLAAATFNPSFVTASGGISQAEAALFAGITQGRAYLNIHTSAFGGGEIRDFLVAIPEPSNLGFTVLLLLGVAALRNWQLRR